MTYKEWIDSFKENFPYYNPAAKDENGEEQFPIVAVGVEYGDPQNALCKRNLVRLKKAGFNVCTQSSVTNDKNLVKTLGYIDELDLRFICNAAAFYGGNNAGYINIKNLPGMGGFLLKDEPSYKDMVNPEGVLLKGYRTFMEKNFDIITYINLVGGYEASRMENVIDEKDSQASELKHLEYLKYVKTFQDYFKPSVFSYDYYPVNEISRLLYEGITLDEYPSYSSEGYVNVNYNHFFNTLELFSQYSKDYNRPFWVYTQSLSNMRLKAAFYRPLALEKFLRYEVFAALAYGAQGIVYWAYSTRPNGKDEEGNPTSAYFSGLMNRKGKKTASWYYAKKINNEISQYKHIFLKSQKIRTNIFDSSEICFVSDDDTTSSPKKYSLNISNRKGIIVARFVNSSGQYLFVVSKSMTEYQDIEIEIKEGKIVELTPETSNGPVDTELNKGIYKRIMIPAGYRIFKLK